MDFNEKTQMEKMKCCMCGDVFDVGYEMPNGDYVCATHECCYEYCRCEGKRTTQETAKQILESVLDE